MLKPGSIVTAVLGTDEEEKQRTHYGSLVNGELYRVAGIIKGNQGEVKLVRLADERGYQNASFFAPLSEEEVEVMQAKVKEAEGMGAKMHPKLRRALASV